MEEVLAFPLKFLPQAKCFYGVEVINVQLLRLTYVLGQIAQ